jgi:hypothetical protein
MKRFRLSTLMLLIVIAALSIALVVQQRRSARHKAAVLAKVMDTIEKSGTGRVIVNTD